MIKKNNIDAVEYQFAVSGYFASAIAIGGFLGSGLWVYFFVALILSYLFVNRRVLLVLVKMRWFIVFIVLTAIGAILGGGGLQFSIGLMKGAAVLLLLAIVVLSQNYIEQGWREISKSQRNKEKGDAH